MQELARQLQEKEKLKYEKYLAKKRERKLKKEREKLEQQLARTTEEARLALPQSGQWLRVCARACVCVCMDWWCVEGVGGCVMYVCVCVCVRVCVSEKEKE